MGCCSVADFTNPKLMLQQSTSSSRCLVRNLREVSEGIKLEILSNCGPTGIEISNRVRSSFTACNSGPENARLIGSEAFWRFRSIVPSSRSCTSQLPSPPLPLPTFFALSRKNRGVRNILFVLTILIWDGSGCITSTSNYRRSTKDRCSWSMEIQLGRFIIDG